MESIGSGSGGYYLLVVVGLREVNGGLMDREAYDWLPEVLIQAGKRTDCAAYLRYEYFS